MTIVAPSLLACDFLNIESELKAFETVPELWFHLDIMDGHFVPNLTFGHPVVERISKKTSKPLDAHFMVTNPKFYVDTFKNYGIHNFTFHLESMKDEAEVLQLIAEAKKIYPSVGISIKPKTPIDQLSDAILKAADLILIMSVEPGFGGQGFIETTWERLKALAPKKDIFNFQIQVDGGVGEINAKQLIEHGVDNLVAGSFVFKRGPAHYLDQVNKLRNFN